MKNVIFSIALFLFPLLMSAQNDTAVRERDCSDNIRIKNMMKTVELLCGSDMQGRLAASPGYKKAAKYMALEFSELGLKPYGGKEYFQAFNTEYNEITKPGEVILQKPDGTTKTYSLGKDYLYRVFTGSGKISSNIVFCGYGLCLPKDGYNDYADIDVKGKIVMAFKQNPDWKIGDKTIGDFPRDKARTAKEHGAVGLILVSRPMDKNPQPPIASAMESSSNILQLQYYRTAHVGDLPVIHVTIPVAEEMLGMNAGQLFRLQENIDKLHKPLHSISETICGIEVEARYDPDATTYNVAAIMEGTDPVLKKEYVMVTAHLDHVGKQGKIIFPGANDNASGSAAVLEIARALSACNYEPKRSIMFVLFSSEEHGLDGAKYMALNLPDSAEKIAAVLNMDCISYGDSIQIGNGESSPVLFHLARTTDFFNWKSSVGRTWKGGGADLTPFYTVGIPGLYFASTNSYDNLHLPSDLPETLNKDLYEKIAKLVCKMTILIADGEYKREKVVK